MNRLGESSQKKDARFSVRVGKVETKFCWYFAGIRRPDVGQCVFLSRSQTCAFTWLTSLSTDEKYQLFLNTIALLFSYILPQGKFSTLDCYIISEETFSYTRVYLFIYLFTISVSPPTGTQGSKWWRGTSVITNNILNLKRTAFIFEKNEW